MQRQGTKNTIAAPQEKIQGDFRSSDPRKAKQVAADEVDRR